MQNSTFHISGTHCKACKMLVEDVLSDDTTLMNPSVDLGNETLSLETEEENQSILLEKLNRELIPLGYTLSLIS